MHKFDPDSEIQTLVPARLAASSERTTMWVQQMLECRFCQPFALANVNSPHRKVMSALPAESDAVES